MRLSELKIDNEELNIFRDSEFDALGMSTSKFRNEKVLAFLSEIKFLDSILENGNIVALILKEDDYNEKVFPERYGIIFSKNPKLTFYEIHNQLVDDGFYWERFENEISNSAMVSSSAFVDKNSVKIGNNSIIEPGAIIHYGTIIGDNVIIRSGSVIGSNGFQYLNVEDRVFSVKTGGRVVINNNVEIQHNSCVDRGVLGGDTYIDENVKVDNLVHIAHDDIIGARTFITAGVKLSGRVTIGSDCWIGVNATISNGIYIGNKSKISIGSVVTKDVPDNSTVTGNFAIEHSKFISFIKSIR